MKFKPPLKLPALRYFFGLVNKNNVFNLNLANIYYVMVSRDDFKRKY